MIDTKFRDPLVWKRFGIHHLSPNSINSFLCYRSKWILEKGFKYDFSPNLLMVRGTCVEQAGSLFAEQRPNNIEKVIEYAQNLYDATIQRKDENDYILPQSDEEKEFRKTIPPMIDKVVDLVQKSGDYKGTQKKIVISLSELFGDEDLPNMIGYTDYNFIYDRFPLTIDIKVPRNKSKKMNYGYWLQGMFYYQGQDYDREKGDVKFHQVLSRKSTNRKTKEVTYSADTNEFSIRQYMDENPDEDWKERLYSGINAMKSLLSQCQTWQDVASLNQPNPDDWIWDSEEKLNARRKIWRF